ncbi:MAG: response regulator [Oscillatoria sp. PMC 1068.18]|nr:response regulator [Oscillatoria sp. PMC 1076.18]MEC4987137.1 response regulator [Oscillatoria sp. PMC 1068.18]
MEQEQLQKITGYFLEESKEYVETISDGITKIDQTLADPESTQEVYRAAHSIKGGAAMLNLGSIQKTALHLEDYFKFLKESPVKVDEPLKSKLMQVVGVLDKLLEKLQQIGSIPENVAKSLMAEVEPLFPEIDRELKKLASGGSKPVTPKNSASNQQQNFHKQVLLELRAMLKLFKQQDRPENRSQLQTHCQKLTNLRASQGQKNWVELLQTASGAIANPENSTSKLASIVVKEIKQAAELIVANRSSEIKASQQLEAMASLKTAPTTANSEPVKVTVISKDRQIITVEPEVGMAELNTLADLFAGEEPDFETEEVFTDSQVQSGDDLETEKEDFADLFGDLNQNEASSSESLDQNLSELFGAEKTAKPLQSPSQARTDLEPEEEDLAEILAIDEGTTSADDTGDLFGADFSFEAETTAEVANSTSADDLEDLFGADFSFEGEITAEVANSTSVDDTDDLFGADFSFEGENKAEVANSNSADDLSDLFGADFSFEAESEPKSATLGELEDFSLSPTPETNNSDELINNNNLVTEESQELDELFGERENNSRNNSLELETSQLEESKTSSNLGDLEELFGEFDSVANESTDFNELLAIANTESNKSETLKDSLADLFADEATPAVTPISKPKVTSSTKPVTEVVETKIASIEYFDRFDELELMLNQPISSANALNETTECDFEKLAAWLEQPATAVVAALGEAEVEAEAINTETDSESLVEEDFADVEALLGAMETMGGSSAVSNPVPRPSRQTRVSDQTLKVPVKQMDNLSNLVGELVVNRNSLEQDEERLRQFLDNLLHQVGQLSDVGGRMQDLYERSLLESALLANRNSYDRGSTSSVSNISSGSSSDRTHQVDYDPLEMDRFTGFHLLSQEMIELIVRVRESTSDIEFLVDEINQVARILQQVTNQLQEGLTKSRMVPFAEKANYLISAVKRRCIELKQKKQWDKDAVVHIEGRDTLIDKMILEHISDPMKHLITNAVYHGIELQEVRRAAGKPSAGQITIRAFHQGNQTVISVSDDGAGINPERVKNKAIEKGLITQNKAASLSNIETYELLFYPGFSTNDEADEIAGRGVGMDVIRTDIQDIRGTVNIDSTLGVGTTFTIRLPLTLSICKALCCISNKNRIAFPMDGVEDMIDVPPHKIQLTAEGTKTIFWRDRQLSFQPLSDLLSYNRQIGRSQHYAGKREDDLISIVILRSAGSLLAIQVDQVLGEQEIVIKQLSGPVPKPPGIAGATVLGDGRVMAIADVLELIDISQGRIRKDGANILWQKDTTSLTPESSAIKSEPLVLIVDDSITVRELLSITFSKSGYRVEQARDGHEAWEKLSSGLPCDIVFCDIEMPRMDGLELLSRMQKDPEIASIPIAMLTSRGAERHRQVAAQQGASGYFTKPYLEEVLLDAAHRMIKGEVLLANSTRKSKPQPTVSATPSFVHELPPKSETKVLIVDDSVVVRELLSATFKKAGYQVEQARDGQDAWEKLNSNLGFDIVFCDIEMPRMDGLKLLSKLQEDEKLSQVPVAMITSRGAKKHQQKAANKGAKGYFVKPYKEPELLDAAERMLQGEILLQAEAI